MHAITFDLSREKLLQHYSSTAPTNAWGEFGRFL